MKNNRISFVWLMLLFLTINIMLQSCKAPYNAQKNVNTYDSIATLLQNKIAVDESKKGKYRASNTRLHDLLHTKLEVSFNWEKQYLYGNATLSFKPYFYPQKELVLDAKGFDIQKVLLLENGKEKKLTYTYNKKKLSIQLPRKYNKEEQFNIFIQYTAKPNELEREGSEAIKEAKGLYFINPEQKEAFKPQQIWTQGETEASSCWFPTIDSPNEKCTQEIYITVQDNFSTISNGVLVFSRKNDDGTRTDYWKMDQPHAPYLFMMAIGEYAVVKDKWNDIDVNYYVEPFYEKHAKAIFGNTPEMLSFFSEKLNYKYPWPKYSQIVVRDYVSGAMENTTASIFMEQLQVDSRTLLDENWDKIIAHELFHHWFGDLVTCESWSNLPLNESFANYSEYLWLEHKYGVDEADYHALEEFEQYLDEAENKQVDLIRFRYDKKEDMFDRHSYNKGGLILHMLRKYVGDKAFFKALNIYLTENQYTAVEAHHLRLAFEKATGQDLNWFFNQWFFASGHPILEIEDKYLDGKVILKVKQKQELSSTPLYKLPLFVDIWVNNKKTRHFIEIQPKQEQEFTFDVSSKPNLVLFDAEQQLLAEVNHKNKTENQKIYQYYHADKLVAKFKAIEKIESIKNENHKKLALDALQDTFWLIRLLALNLNAQLILNKESKNKIETQEYQKIVNKIKNIAEYDKKPIVKATAIRVLALLKPQSFINFFEKGLQDSAYSVFSASLLGHLYSGLKCDKRIIDNIEQTKNQIEYLELAKIYIAAEQHEKYDWFIKKINTIPDEEKFYLIQYFGFFLTKTIEQTQKKGIEYLKNIAQTHTIYEIRLSAYYALQELNKNAEVKRILHELKEKEKDPRAKNDFN